MEQGTMAAVERLAIWGREAAQVSLDARTQNETDDGAALGDRIAHDGGEQARKIERRAVEARRVELLWEGFGKLPARVRAVIALRFGIRDEWTLEEIGDALELSRERIRQLQREGLLSLRQHISARPLWRPGEAAAASETTRERVSEVWHYPDGRRVRTPRSAP